MGKSIFTKIFGVFWVCALFFASDVVMAEYTWPECDTGYWYHSGFYCDKCPEGFDLAKPNASMVTHCYRTRGLSTWWYNTKSCRTGFYLPKGSAQCTQCPSGSWCPGGIFGYDLTKDQGIYSCPSTRKHSGEGTSKVTECYAFLTANGVNVSKIYFTGCDSGTYFNGTSCVACPSGYGKTYEGATATKPEDCYNDKFEHYNEVKCSSGQYLPKNSRTCAPCTGDSVCSFTHTFFFDTTKDQGASYRCPHGKKPSDDKKTCVDDNNPTIHCNSGYYLKAGANSCNTACPSGCTCAGGDFYYSNTNDQGKDCNGGGDRLCEDGYYKDSAAGCIKCQAGFSHSDADATTKFKCWDYDTKNRKMYYKYIDGTGTENNPKTCDSTANCTKCPDNTYVKAKTNWCSACPSGKVCMGGWYFPNMNADLGISDKDSHGCRVGGTGSIQNAQYWENNTCKDCPNDFFLADPNATSRDQCYKQIGNNKKLYYKKVSCGAGQYLPKASSECKSCLDGYYCTADTYYPNLKDDQGLKNCPSGQVPNSNKTACTNDAGGNTGGTETCKSGEYLPAGLGRCQSCTAIRKYCPGGTYQYPKSVDQGILDCPTNAVANTKHDGCYFNLSPTYLKNGPSGAQTKFENQCWVKTNINSYAKCLFPNGATLTSGGVPDDPESAEAPAYEGPAAD